MCMRVYVHVHVSVIELRVCNPTPLPPYPSCRHLHSDGTIELVAECAGLGFRTVGFIVKEPVTSILQVSNTGGVARCA